MAKEFKIRISGVTFVESDKMFDGDELALFYDNFSGWDYCDFHESDLLLLEIPRKEAEKLEEQISDFAYPIQGYGNYIEDADNIFIFVIDTKNLDKFVDSDSLTKFIKAKESGFATIEF